ncbi:MAG: zinc-dependent peptidase [Cyclobacteriaceae bacterium]
MVTFFVGIAVAFVLGRLITRYQYEYLLNHTSLSSTGLKPSQKAILAKHFNFYNLLPPKSRKIFEHRVAKFISLKEFIPRNMDEVTEEMQVLIAASAIQLTFGLPKIFLRHFKYILVFPDDFYNHSSNQYHKGEVNPMKKAIVLSWKHFVEGYIDNEGINLGLHEMAHALQLENIVENGEFDFLKDEDIKKWQHLAADEITKMKNGEATFFREYGSTNQAEFFSVAVENFFEKPKAFNEYHPELYRVMTDLLNQDPVVLENTGVSRQENH